MALTRSNLRRGSWRFVYDILNANAGSVGSVYSKFPETHQVNFPMTVIDNVDGSDGVITKNNMMADITVPVTFYNKSGKNIDNQVDVAINVLEGSRVAFMGSAIKLMSINDAGQGTNTYGDTTVHFKAMNVNFMCLV